MSVSSVQNKVQTARNEPAVATAPKAVATAPKASLATTAGARTQGQSWQPSTRDQFTPASAADRKLSFPGLNFVEGMIKSGLSMVARGAQSEIEFVRSQLNRLLGPGSTGQPGWMQRDPSLPPTKDVTTNFHSVYADAAAGKDTLPPDADKYVYLTIRGLTGNHWPNYMEPTRQGLIEKGLDARDIPIHTEDSTEANAAKIRDAILEASKGGKQVVLIGHSKGGLDSTAAISMYPELKDKVRALVAIQSPYGGAPLATDLRSNALTKAAVGFLAKDIFGGSSNCIRDLSYEFRQQFIKDHPFSTKDIPTLSLATSSSDQLSGMAAPANYTALRYGEKSDGLVVDKDAMIPGSDVVHIEGLDHMESIMPLLPGTTRYDQKALSVALVSMVLNQPRANA